MKISADLLERLSLCKRRRQAVEQAATHEKVKTLIDIMSRRRDSAFTQLLGALRDTNQNKAVVIIGGSDQSVSETLASEFRTETWKTTKVYPLRQIERGSLDETTGDAWSKFQDELINLVHLAKSAGSGDFGKNFSSRIDAASRDVATSFQKLREQQSLPMSRSMSDIRGTMRYMSERQLRHASHHSG